MKKDRTGLVFGVTTLLLLGVSPASAQTAAPSWWITVGAGGQLTKHEKASTVEFPVYDETASLTWNHKVGAGLLVDVSGAYRIGIAGLAVGAGFSWFRNTATTAVTASIPDPLVFDTHAASTTSAKLTQQEKNIHVDVVYTFHINDKLDLAASGGPAFYRVSRGVLTGANIPEGTQNATPTTGKQKLSATGGMVGFDASYLLSKRIRVLGFARFAAANTKNPAGQLIRVGGLQVGGAFRIQ
jgi:hypothetical protein